MEEQPQPNQRRRSARRIANQQRREEQIAQRQPQREEQPQNLNVDNAPQQIINAMEEEQKQPEREEVKEAIQPPEEEMNVNKLSNPFQLHNQEIPNKNFAPERFLAKIPNTRTLRDFLANTGGYYCPPLKDLTNAFCRDILSGKKKLMKSKDVLFVDDVPRWPEFSTKTLWQKVKNSKVLSLYFPDFASSKLPQRRYLLNIANTVSPNSVIKAVLNIRRQRQKQQVDRQPIIITAEFANLFNQFASISTGQQRAGRLRLQQPKQIEQCPLCLQPLSRANTANFNCVRHQAHKKCIIQYMQSGHFKNNAYLCPLRCKEV